MGESEHESLKLERIESPPTRTAPSSAADEDTGEKDENASEDDLKGRAQVAQQGNGP